MAYKYRPRKPRKPYLYPNAPRRDKPERPKRDPNLPITYSAKPVNWSSDMDSIETVIPWNHQPTATSKSNVLISLAQAMNSRTGFNVPGYKSLIRRHLEASESSYTRVTYSAEGSDGSLIRVYQEPSLARTHIYSRSGQMVFFTGWPALTSLETPSLDAKAQGGFLQKLYNKQTAFSGGKFLGELRQTIHGITHPLQAIYFGFFDYARTLKARAYTRRWSKRLPRYGGRAAVLNKMVASTWLEFQFGWKPLLNDLDDAMQSLAYLQTYRAPTDTCTFSASNTTVSEAPEAFGSYGYWRYDWSVRTKNTTKIKYAGGFKCISDLDGSTWFPKSLGVSLSDVVPTIWEILPYSFLVDYFVNVGEVLEGAMAIQSQLFYLTKSVRVVCNKQTTQPIVTDQFKTSGNPIEGSYGYFSGAGSLSATVESYTRTRLIPGGLSPALRVQLPGSGSLRWLNMLALVGQGKSVEKSLQNLGRQPYERFYRP